MHDFRKRLMSYVASSLVFVDWIRYATGPKIIIYLGTSKKWNFSIRIKRNDTDLLCAFCGFADNDGDQQTGTCYFLNATASIFDNQGHRIFDVPGADSQKILYIKKEQFNGNKTILYVGNNSKSSDELAPIQHLALYIEDKGPTLIDTVYSLRIWSPQASEDNPEFDLRPCLYQGKYGLWNMIDNSFHGNSGEGGITGGYGE